MRSGESARFTGGRAKRERQMGSRFCIFPNELVGGPEEGEADGKWVLVSFGGHEENGGIYGE